MEPPILPTPQTHDHRKHRHATYAAESTGLLILAVLLLVFTIFHYWRDIPWAAR